jgi:excisionase family DNA binding protein
MLEVVQVPPFGGDGGRVPFSGYLNRAGQTSEAGSSGMAAEPKRLKAKQVMTIAELADYFGTSPLEVRKLFHSQKEAGFPAFKLRNKWCVNLEDVQDWLLAMADQLEGSR